MIDRKEDIYFLQDTLSFWKRLTERQRTYLKQVIVKKLFAAGETMHGKADKCSGLFLIRKGQIRAYIISESGKEITLYHLFDRDVCIFSASCVMKNITFDIYIEMEKDTEAYVLPTNAFMRLSEESMPIQTFTNHLLASRLSEIMWVLEQALFTSFDKRLANFLLEQTVIEASSTITITHERIANHLGSAREVVTRMLKYFQSEGMVKLNRGSIEITGQDKLEKLVDEIPI